MIRDRRRQHTGVKRNSMEFLHPMELRVQIKLGLVFFMTFIVPVIVFGSLLLVSINRILENNLYSYQETNINQLTDALDEYFINLNRVARDLTSDISFTIGLSAKPDEFEDKVSWEKHRTKISEHIGEQITSEESILGYYLLTDKQIAYTSHEVTDSLEPESLIPQRISTGIIKDGLKLVLYRHNTTYLELQGNMPVLFCALPISIVYLEEKRFGTGVLVLFINPGEIDSIFQSHNPTSNQLYLFDNHGLFIHSNIREVSYKKIPSELSENARFNKTGRYKVRDGSGDSLISFTTSRFNSVKIFGYTSDNLIRDDIFFLSKNTLMFLFALIIFFILFIIFLSYSISSPINRLRTIIAQLEVSNYKDVSELLDRKNKGILSTYFDRFFTFLYTVFTQINEYHMKEKEHELLVLQSQVNPHFVYNTLNTIRIMAELEGQEKLAKAIRSLIHLLKKSIRFGSVFISIRDEIDQIRDYITLQKLRYNDSFQVRFSIDNDVLNYKCIKFILQPIVENAIFHGIDPGSGDGLITISISKEGNTIRYRVEDNGYGIDEETLSELNESPGKRKLSEKIGIHNVNSRLLTYFGPDCHLNIQSIRGSGTVVTYIIPVEPYAD